MKNYLIDLDGTLYRGNEAVEYAAEFIGYLNQQNRKYLLLTNCPLCSPRETANKLMKMGIQVNPRRVLNCGMSCADYLMRNRPSARVYLIGSPAFRTYMEAAGVTLCAENADVVVVGYDTEMTYAQLSSACIQIQAGADFIATNPDNVIPSGGTFVPHTGAIAAAIAYATGKSPLVIGKPQTYMLSTAQHLLQCDKEDCAVIGDRLDTDMAFADNCGIAGNLVLTGFTKRSMLTPLDLQKFRVFATLREIILMEKEGCSDVL